METQELKNMEPEDKFNRSVSHRQSNNFLGGLIIVAIGVIYLFKEMGLGIPGYIFSWQAFLIGLGLFIGARKNFRGPGWLILILIGSYFLLNEYFYWNFALSKYLVPLGVIAVGLVIMLKPKRHRSYQCSRDGVSSEDSVEITNVFGGTKRTFLSKNFKGGQVQSVFGGVVLNLSQCDFTGTVILNIENVFGGTKLIVPANWDVKIETVSVVGGVDDKRPVSATMETADKTLIIKGSCVFGGIEISSYA